METFGSRLRRLRSERGLQQADLTGPGVSISYISMLENDKREPTPRVITHLAAALQVDPLELVGPTPEIDLDDTQRLELAEAEILLAHGDWASAHDTFAEMETRYGLPATWGLARALEALGRLEEALAAIDRVIAAPPNDSTQLVRAHISRARCLAEQGQEAEALASARRAVACANEAGLEGTDEHVQALSMLVGQLYAVGLYADAELAATDLLRLVDEGASWKARGSAYWNAAGVAEARGDLGTAVAHSQRALAILSEGDDDRAWARCAVACAWFWMRQDITPERLVQVDQILRVAEPKLHESGTELDLAYLETEQARAALLEQDPQRAEALAESSLARLGPEPRSERATTLLVLAQARTNLGQDDVSATAEQLELTLLTLPRSRGNTLTWRGLADVWKHLGNTDGAYRALEEALNSQAISPSPTHAATSQTTEEAARRT